MPKPTKLTPEIQSRLVQALSAGNYFDTAARYAGVSPQTARQWLDRGEGKMPDRPATPLYVAFVEAVRKAESDAEVRPVALVVNDMKDNPESAKWFLAHRYPAKWGRTTAEVKLTGDKLIQVLEGLSAHDFAAVLAHYGVHAAALASGGTEAGADTEPGDGQEAGSNPED